MTGPLAPRVVDCRSAAMLIKSALRDWLSVSYVTQYPVPPIFSFPLEGKCHVVAKGCTGLSSDVILYRYPDRHSAAPLSGANTTLGTEGRQARWMPYAPLRRRRRPLREYWKAPPKSRSRSRPRRKAPEPSSPTGLVHLNLHAPISKAAFLLTTSLTCIRHAGIM